MNIQTLPLGAVRPDPDQPRKRFDVDEIAALGASIQEVGLIQPITVRPDMGGYVIVAGERRWRAHVHIGADTIQAIVRSDLADPSRRQDAAIAENTGRRDLDPVEEARAFQAQLDRGLTLEDVARRSGRPRSFVERRLLLLALDQPLQRLVSVGQLQVGHAEALAKLPDREDQYAVLRVADSGRVNGFDLERLVQQTKARREQGELWSDVDVPTKSQAARELHARFHRAIQDAVEALVALRDPRTMQLIPQALEGDSPEAIAEKLRLLSLTALDLRADVNAALAGREASLW